MTSYLAEEAIHPYNQDFENIYDLFSIQLSEAPEVRVGEWQAIQDDSIPQAATLELEDVSFQVVIPETADEWAREINPNLPWAEEHFMERVSGIPVNPPPSHVRWPFAQKSNSEHMADEKFSHTYPERFWPKFAGNNKFGMDGIRYHYGDLGDLVNLLKSRPGTRQAYLPVWFPEDLAAAEEYGHRVPCSLGYHFLLRNGKLKVVYYIRSCDLFRHFRDDVYMAGRLCQWVAEELNVLPGRLVMHISSLHVFAAERGRLEYAAAGG